MPQRLASILPILLYFLVMSTSESRAQTLDWIRLESDEKDRNALAGVASDGSGIAVIAGFTRRSPTAETVVGTDIREAFLSKYDSIGNQLWSVDWGGECCSTLGNGTALDQFGNAYIVGETRRGDLTAHLRPNIDAFIAKYDTDGNLIWDEVLGSGEADRLSAVAVTHAGSVYAAGRTLGKLGEERFGDDYNGVLAKFDDGGNREWLVQFDSTAPRLALSVDGEGAVIASELHGVRKFGSDGAPLWHYDLGEELYFFDSAVGTDGSVTALGVTSRQADSENRIVLTKLDSSGTLIWDREFRIDETQRPGGVAVDANGSIFVTGQSEKVSVEVDKSVFLSRFDRDGQLEWTTELDYVGDQLGNGVAIGRDGSVFVAGRVRCEDNEPNCGVNGQMNALLARFNVNENFTPGDFNFDGQLSILDVDLFSTEIQDGSVNSFFDLNQDLAVTSEDLALWITDNNGTFVGDTNLDFKVDFDDFLALSGAFGHDGSWSHGDFDASGSIDFADFLLLSQNFGNAAAITAAHVPEPSSAVCGLIAAMCLALLRTRHCRTPDNPGVYA